MSKGCVRVVSNELAEVRYKMDTRDNITRELLLGISPAQLARRYPRKSVYRIYKELDQSGQLPEPGVVVIDSEAGQMGGQSIKPEGEQLFAPEPPAPSAIGVREREDGTETVDIGPKSLPTDAVNRIRGILGITLRPKVLSCPMPELLYPAMVIAVTELGFEAMRPDDFIDTVLYQWLEACDYIPYAYMKRSEIKEYAMQYGFDSEEYAKKHGLMTEDDFAKKFNITLSEKDEDKPDEDKPDEDKPKDVDEVVVEPEIVALKEQIAEIQEDAKEEAEETGNEPHKPTVGDLLKRLHITNIQKEVAEDDRAGRTKSIGSQSGDALNE